MLADYVLVVFAAGGRHYPDFKWFWTAWGRLGRPFRKNLKKLVRASFSCFLWLWSKQRLNRLPPLESPAVPRPPKLLHQEYVSRML